MAESVEGNLENPTADSPEFAEIIAVSLEMQRAKTLAKRGADLDLPILLEGEPGTGKRLLARCIHRASVQKHGLFRALRFPPPSEERAAPAVPGGSTPINKAWAEAKGGTLFLDDINNMLAHEQDVLHDLLLQQVPGAVPVSERVRLICASGRNLIEMVKNGQFSEKLYYQISVFPIWLPPLRLRTDDIPDLAKAVLGQIVAELGKPIDKIDPQAEELLRNYSWPGNVRQLENSIFRAVALADGYQLTLKEFPQITAQMPGYRALSEDQPAPEPVPLPFSQSYEGPAMIGGPLPAQRAVSLTPIAGSNQIGVPVANEDGEFRSLEDIEADVIRLALGHYRGHITEIARRLGIGRSTLYRKMREFGLMHRHN